MHWATGLASSPCCKCNRVLKSLHRHSLTHCKAFSAMVHCFQQYIGRQIGPHVSCAISQRGEVKQMHTPITPNYAGCIPPSLHDGAGHAALHRMCSMLHVLSNRQHTSEPLSTAAEQIARRLAPADPGRCTGTCDTACHCGSSLSHVQRRWQNRGPTVLLVSATGQAACGKSSSAAALARHMAL